MSRLTHRLLLRRVLEAADLVIAVSQATQKLARRFFDVADKTVLIGEGVGRDIVVQSGQETRSRVARLLGEVGDFLLTVGTIEPRKNHRLLLDALERMDSPPLLVVVGRQGWRSARLRARMRTFEAAGRLRALGFVSDEDLAALYREAVLVVCPSVYEGFGLPVLEAMAHGCPVVCSWSSSLPEIGLAAARYFDPKDAAQLARVLAELLADRDARQTMARLGVTRAAEFSFSTASAALLAAIDRLGGPDRFGHGGRARYGPAGGQSRLTAA